VEVPNLKALADVMNAEYSRNGHGAIIKATMDEISNYFDTLEGKEKKPSTTRYWSLEQKLGRGFKTPEQRY
jgi:hypothetical protein